jgi:hypothetical protein
LNESWGSFSSSWCFGGGCGSGWCISGGWGTWGGWDGSGIRFSLSFSLSGISHNLLNWCWCFDVEVWLLNNMVWHVSNPGLPWGI